MIKKSVLDKFVRLGGYEIVKRKRGKWKNISEASRRTGLSRMTIYRLLEEYPEAPRKTLPKYVAEFHESEGYRRLKEEYEKKLSQSEYRNTIHQVMEAWKFLNKKDPISWDEDDFRKIWNNEKWHNELAGGFEEHNATKFHRLMRAIRRCDLLAKFRGKKIPAGAKKEWFLHDSDIIKITGKFNDKGALVYYECGILWGARSSALLNVKVKDINFEDNSVTVFEPKTKQYVQKFPPLCIFKFLRKYIND